MSRFGAIPVDPPAAAPAAPRSRFGAIPVDEQAAPATAPEPSWLERRAADLRANARAAAEGIGGTIGIVTDPFAQGLQGLSNMVTGNNTRAMTMAETFGAGAEAVGLPALDPDSPATPIMRGTYGALPTLGAGALAQGGARLAPTVTQRVGQTLAARPTMQLVAGGTAAGSVDAARDAGIGPGGQILAGLAGGLAPAGLQAGVQRAVVGGGRAQVAQAVDDFARLGTTPTVGQATGSRFWRGVETFLSRVPGGAGRMAQTAERQADEVGAQVQQIAGRLSPRGDAASAGRAIERGITGSGGFLDRTGRQAAQLYDEVDQFLPADTSVPLTNLRRVLAETTAPLPGAQRLSEAASSPAIRRMADDLNADLAANARMGMNGMPYGSVKALRSRIGEMLDDAALNPDINTQQLRRVYGAFSDDMAQAAATAGPEAQRAMTRANNFFRARMARLENIERVVQANGGPERVFASAMSGSREGATTIGQVMRSLPPESQRIVASTVIRRMGTAVASQQDETGGVFSLGSFLTNWNRLHPSARSALFSRFAPEVGRDLDALGRVAANVRTGSQVFANPSGTAQAVNQAAAVVTAGGALAMGRLEVAGGVLGGMALTNSGARLMTSPTFVRWLARSRDMTPAAYQSSVQGLAAAGMRDDDPELVEFARRLNERLEQSGEN